jgi:hypothetical protein
MLRTEAYDFTKNFEPDFFKDKKNILARLKTEIPSYLRSNLVKNIVFNVNHKDELEEEFLEEEF